MTVTNNIIPTDFWDNWIQDTGTSGEKLDKKPYKQYKIAPNGPESDKFYYYGLSCIAIDLIKVFKHQKELGLGWKKMPKNQTNTKVKIITTIMVLRKLGDNGKYKLD